MIIFGIFVNEMYMKIFEIFRVELDKLWSLYPAAEVINVWYLPSPVPHTIILLYTCDMVEDHAIDVAFFGAEL